ncbi:MAG: DUF1585 domain-containing protein [Myxococcales bacterium]|nr:MAG: DUF1585 domain-containing protein [Myxococcales bacterium]
MSLEVADCVSRRWFRQALGRVEQQSDTEMLDALEKELASEQGNLRLLLMSIVGSETFRSRMLDPSETGVSP